MGARPIASLNSLRFGDLKEAKTQRLLAGVVHGIGHYGNCFGVPTVGGEIYFAQAYHTNPLVNAMSVGIVKEGETVSATAKGKAIRYFLLVVQPEKMELVEHHSRLLILQQKVQKNFLQFRLEIHSRKRNCWRLVWK
jgi:hypothetical protein